MVTKDISGGRKMYVGVAKGGPFDGKEVSSLSQEPVKLAEENGLDPSLEYADKGTIVFVGFPRTASARPKFVRSNGKQTSDVGDILGDVITVLTKLQSRFKK